MSERQRYHHGDLRRALLEEALSIVREEGERGFSLRAAARAVGVDPAAAYRHFKNKDAVLHAVAEAAFSELARRIEEEQRGATQARERMHAIGRAYVYFAKEEPQLFRIAFGPRATGLEPPRGVAESGRDPHQMLVDALEDLEAEGGLHLSVDRAALPAWSAVHGLAHLILAGRIPAEAAEAATRDVLDATLRGLSA